MAIPIGRASRASISFILVCLTSLAVQAAPPSAGSIFQQTQTAPALPSAPASVLRLPAPNQQVNHAGIRIAVQRIEILGNTLISSGVLAPLMAPLQGHTVTLGALRQAAEKITRLYRARGYSLAFAYVPAQKIKQGVVRIRVVEPRYDRIQFEGHSRLNAGEARRTLGLQPGRPIRRGSLERGLLLLNETPGIRVAGTLVPGARAGTSRLLATLTNIQRVQASVSLDNDGNAATGHVRANLGITLNDPWGYGSQVSVDRLASQGGLLHATSAALSSPDVYRGMRLGVYGTHTTYRLGGSFARLGETGRATQLGLDLSYPVLLAPGRILNARFDVLGDRFAEESPSAGIDDRSHIDLMRLSLDGALAGAFGSMTSAGVSVTRGRLYLDSPYARTADAAGPHAAGDFWLASFSCARRQPLPQEFDLHVSLRGQLASRNLNDSEKFYLGGTNGVMSYAEGDGGGDGGALLRVRLGHGVPITRLPGHLRAGLLVQWGEVWRNHSPYHGMTGSNRLQLAGGGVGLSWHWRNRLDAQLDYVRRLGGTPAVVPATDGQFWASLQLTI